MQPYRQRELALTKVTNPMSFAGDSRVQPRGPVLPARGARSGAVAARARRLLPCAALPRAAAHLYHRHVRADQVRQHQAENEQQACEPHVPHRVQQLHQAARGAAAAGGARAVAGRGPRRVLRGAARPRPRLGAPLSSGARAPPPRQLSRARALAAPRDPLIESLLFYERDARRDLFFYFPRGRPAPPAACDIRTIFHNFLYSRSLRRCVNLSIGAIIGRATRRRFIFVIFNAESSF